MGSADFVVEVDAGTLQGQMRGGSGEPLLVLHGGPGLSDYSELMVAELTGWRALCYTQRGPEPSNAPGPYSVDGHVADALAVLDHLGVDQAVVLGHSWGAFLACCLAAAAPSRVRALVLVDGLGLVGDGGEAEFGARMSARTTEDSMTRMEQLDQRAQRGEGTPEDFVEMFRLGWPAYFADPPSAPELTLPMRGSATCYGQTFDSLRRVLADGTIAAALRSYPGPVEVVHGASSAMPASASTRTADLFPHAQTTAVADAGHFLWIEQPGAVAAALTRVSRRLPATGQD